MGIITWQNISIPQLDATSGARVASDMFQRAAEGAKATADQVQGIDDAQKKFLEDSANRELTVKSLGITDPGAYQQARPGLIDPLLAQHASLDTLQGIDKRQDLLQQRSDIAYKSNREQEGNRRADAVDMTKAIRTAVHDRPKGIKELGEIPGFSDMNHEDRTRGMQLLYGAAQDTSQGAATNLKLTEFQIDAQAAELIDQVRGLTDGKDIAKLWATYPGSSLVKSRAEDMLKQKGDPIVQFIGTSPTQYGDVLPPSVSNKPYGYENAVGRQYGGFMEEALRRNPGLQPPDKNASMGDWVDFSERYIRPVSGELNATPMGPAQVVNQTRREFVEKYGEEIFGTKDLRKIPMTLENEEKLAKKIYQVRGAAPWAASLGSYKSFSPEFFKDKSWEEARPLIFRLEGGVLPDNHAKTVDLLEELVTQKARQLPLQARAIMEAEGQEKASLAEVVAKTAEKLNSQSPDQKVKINPGELNETIQKYMNYAHEHGVKSASPAEIAGLLVEFVREDGITTLSELSKNTHIEGGKLEEAIKQLDNGRMDYRKHKKNAEAPLKKLQDHQAKFTTNETMLNTALGKAKEHPNNGDAVLRALHNLERLSNEMGSMLNALPKEEPKPAEPPGPATPAITAKSLKSVADDGSIPPGHVMVNGQIVKMLYGS